MPIDVDAIKERGWRQGALFSEQASTEILGQAQQGASQLILASHDCNIVHRNNGEPFIDVFEAVPIAAVSPTEARARNGRQLHLNVTIGGNRRPHKILYSSRLTLRREVLCQHAIDQNAVLATTDLQSFVTWLSVRYSRVPLPDAFNARLNARNARTQIRAIIGQDNKCLSDIYLELDPEDEELDDGVPYLARVALIMTQRDAEDETLVQQASEIAPRLLQFLRSCDSIDAEVDIITEDEFTLADLQTYRHWDFTDLSLGD